MWITRLERDENQVARLKRERLAPMRYYFGPQFLVRPDRRNPDLTRLRDSGSLVPVTTAL